MLRKITYNLYKYSNDLYLPNVFWASVDNHGKLAHVKKKAKLHHIEKSENKEKHQRLFKIIESLTPEYIENKYIANKRETADFTALLNNSKTKNTVLGFIDRSMNEFFKLISQNNFPICLDLMRDGIVNNYLLYHNHFELKPQLHFKRNKDGITYQMRLQDNNIIWQIQTKKVISVCNNPAWIVADNILYKIAHINANMVKPFSEKEQVFIPERIVKTYFEKFILKVAKKVDIEADGFDVIIKDKLQQCRIILFKNLFNNNWEVSLKMIYSGADFIWNDKKTNKTSIEFIKDDISIIKIVRDQDAESKFIIKIIKEFKLENISGNSFVKQNSNSNPLEQNTMLEWLINNKNTLQKAGFEVENPRYNNELILLDIPKLKISSTQQNDWFDIDAIIKIGSNSFPFAALKQNILDNNPYFTLSDGKVFIIPKEWMEKYSELFKFAKNKGDKLQLNKSHFTIINNADVTTFGKTSKEFDEAKFQTPKSLKATLRPYQFDGLKWLVKLYYDDLGGCLADDMGLGKTLQTIAILLFAKEQKIKNNNSQTGQIVQLNLFSNVNQDELFPLNALIIMPASLIYNWKAELLRFAPSLKVYSFIGAKREKSIPLLETFDIILTTYQTALRDIDLLKEMTYDYIVLDESQQIKNRRSKVFNAIMHLKAFHKISLSGTPIENSLSDLWSQMQFINTELLGDFKFFEREFLEPIEKYSDEDKVIQLRKLVQPFLLRRTKKEVEKNLPELIVKTHYSKMTTEQERIYEKEKSIARNYLLKIFDRKEDKYKLQILQVLNKLRQIANHPVLVQKDYIFDSGKFRDILEQWETINKAGHKVLIFSSYVKHLNLFEKEFKKRNIQFSYLKGSLTQNQRKQQIQNFKEDKKVNSFLISIKAGSVGHNLTMADYVFILDPWWNPSTEQQAIARAHRIGQDKKVIAIKFITNNTLEEKILNLQLRKSQLADDILNNNEKLNLTKKDINYLLD